MRGFSDEHKLFLKKLKREKIFVLIFRIGIILLLLTLWEILSRIGIINTFLFSSPSRVFNTCLGLIKSGELFKHLGISLFEILLSVFISFGIGFIIASCFWRCKLIYKIFDSYITILNSLPKVALGPLIIIWVGASTNSIIFMALLISIFITIINIYNGFISVNENYITMMRSFGASKMEIFFRLILPSNIYNILSTLKIDMSMNLIGVIMGELLVSKCGIGYLIMYGSQVFNIDLVITGVFILGIISYLLYEAIEFMEKKITK